MPVYRLPDKPIFPHPDEANEEGLLAIGGDLSVERLIAAYVNGIFPWYNSDDPILWWSPNPRLVLYPDDFKISKSLKQTLKSKKFSITIDCAFKQVIRQCKTTPRKGETGTWITPEMEQAYNKLHELGFAHSVETWRNNKLVGGLYGLSIGKMFFGESMFHKDTDASKVAFYYLSLLAKKWEFPFIDCQVPNAHLISLGAREMERKYFLEELSTQVLKPGHHGKWNNVSMM